MEAVACNGSADEPPKKMLCLGNECLICRCSFIEPYKTACGHIFCHSCIKASLECSPSCPTCHSFIGDIASLESGHTATSMTALADSMEAVATSSTSGPASASTPQAAFTTAAVTASNSLLDLVLNTPHLKTDEIRELIKYLQAELNARDTKGKVLRDMAATHFLTRLYKETKEVSMESLIQLEAVEKDLAKLKDLSGRDQNVTSATNCTPHSTNDLPNKEGVTSPVDLRQAEPTTTPPLANSLHVVVCSNVDKHFDDLRHLYTSMKMPDKYVVHAEFRESEGVRLRRFTTALRQLTKPAELNLVKSLRLNDSSHGANHIYSIEMNPLRTGFAVASSSGGVKIFDYQHFITATEPFNAMATVLKPTDIATYSATWNRLRPCQLVFCDQQGRLWLWDTAKLQPMQFREHSSRPTTHSTFPSQQEWPQCQCVFHPNQPDLCLSGSHDRTVRLWDFRKPASVAMLRTLDAVTGIHFRPGKDQEIGVAAGDTVKLYDMRNLLEPRTTLSCDGRISNFTFLGEEELVAGTLNGQMLHWNITRGQVLCSYGGVINSRWSVGMATVAADTVATTTSMPDHSHLLFCGSEDNSVMGYCKHLSVPLLRRQFARPTGLLSQLRPQPFISALACRPDETLSVLAGSSHGSLKLLEVEQTSTDS
eukprot:scpid40739/ scgid6818/ E3 ubiquitin-protein ligase RFWD2; Constitutive photomorphogenesis protein 1 homolog; RING finger and WD repeat domain protein 2; RING finger protein 200